MMLCAIGSANEVFQWKRRDREGQAVKLRRDEGIARQHLKRQVLSSAGSLAQQGIHGRAATR
jgi:hypothetical protein